MSKLDRIVKKIEEIKERQARMKGERQATINQLKDEFGVSTLKEASEMLVVLSDEYKEKSAELDSMIYELEELVHESEI